LIILFHNSIKMKVIKNIAYDGAPQEAENGLIAKVKVTVGNDTETDALFYATFNHVAEIPYSEACTSVGNAIEVIKSSVLASCQLFVTNNFNQ